MDENNAEAYYLVEARDQTGEVVSRGHVPAQKLEKARRLFEAEGWSVEASPVAADQLPAHLRSN